MQITSRFTMAVHIITAISYFQTKEQTTSDFLAASVGANPVLVRTVIARLRDAGIVTTKRGSAGTVLAKPLEEITFYDIYKAVDSVDETGLFHFHEHPSLACPVGRNLHSSLDGKLTVVQEAMEAKMKQITLAEVVDDTIAIIQSEQDQSVSNEREEK